MTLYHLWLGPRYGAPLREFYFMARFFQEAFNLARNLSDCFDADVVALDAEASLLEPVSPFSGDGGEDGEKKGFEKYCLFESFSPD